MEPFSSLFLENPIIAAVRTEADFLAALDSDCAAVFLLNSSIESLGKEVQAARNAGKKLFLHIDLAAGIGKDEAGVRFAAACGVDGIISTRGPLIRAAKECGVLCVQRFFMVDSHSVETAAESLRTFHPDMAEIMPGVAFKTVEKLRKCTGIPLIAGGLLEDREDIYRALSAGACAVSVGKKALWGL